MPNKKKQNKNPTQGIDNDGNCVCFRRDLRMILSPAMLVMDHIAV